MMLSLDRIGKMGVRLLLFWALASSIVHAQSPLDSMELLLPTLSGDAKMSLAGELAYQFCYVNTTKALKYGQLELQMALKKGDSMEIAQAWNDLGAVHASRGEFEQSVEYSAAALGVRARMGDSLLVANSCNKLGFALLDMGVHEQALSAFLRAARIYEHEKKLPLLANVYNNIGSVHLRQGNNDKALEFLYKASAMGEEIGDANSMISAKTNIASIQFEDGDYAAAQQGYEELLLRMAEVGHTVFEGTVRMNLGACLLRKGDYAQGIHNLRQADSIFAKKDDAKGQAMTQVNLALCHIGQQDYVAATTCLDRARQWCTQVNSDQQWQLLYDGFYRLKSAQGQVDEAMQYYAQASRYRKKIYNAQASLQIAEMETKYETEKKEQALVTAQLRNRNQILIIVGLVALLVFAITLVLFNARNQRLKRQGLAQQAMMALQEERLRIARDLHDHIGAELTLITVSAEESVSAGADVLQSISGYARNAMAQLRETVWAIKNDAILVDAFAQRLGDFAVRLCQPIQIAAQVQVTGDGAKVLSAAATLVLYRLCQEAIHNAVKYSGSKTLHIAIVAHGGHVTVSIADQGVGFDMAQVKRGDGIANMHARAAEAGGKVEMKTAVGAGTVVTVSLPC
jgi:signal transduction histidine kinase